MAKLESLDKMGTVVFSQNIESRQHREIEEAARVAGIDEKFVRSLRPRFAFIRGMNALVKEGVVQADLRDKGLDTEDSLEFAFITKLEGYHYDAHCVVRYDKKAQQIHVLKCPAGVRAQDVAAQADRLVQKAKTLWKTTDISTLVKRVLAPHCRRVLLRDGVYFVPYQHDALIDKITKFYDALNFSYYTLSVGHTQVNADKYRRAIVEDIRTEVRTLKSEIDRLKGSGSLTTRIGKRRLIDMRKALRQYHELAQATRVELGQLMEDAGETAKVIVHAAMNRDELVAAITRREAFNPLTVDLFEASETVEPQLIRSMRALAPVLEGVAPAAEQMVVRR